MARFYRTASATPLDYMYKANIPLMERVISANDQYIDQELAQTTQLGTLAAAFPYLKSDEGRAKELTDQYAKEVDNVTAAIRADPANWRQQQNPIRDLSRKLQSDYKVGEISKISENFNTIKKQFDAIDESTKEYTKSGKGIRPEDADVFKQDMLKKWTEKTGNKGTSYDPKTGKYNTIDVYNPVNHMDIKKVLAEGIDKMKASGTDIRQDEQTGMYLKKTTRGWEGVTPQEVLTAMKGNISPDLMKYLKQYSDVGILNNILDDKGSLIEPYSYNPNPANDKETAAIKERQALINKLKVKNPTQAKAMQEDLDVFSKSLADRTKFAWNDQSALAPIMQGIVAEGAWSKSTEFDEIRPDAIKSMLETQRRTDARQATSLAQARTLATEKEKGVNDRFERTIAERIRQFDNPHPKAAAGAKSTGVTTVKSPIVEIPKESSVSKLATNSYEAWETVDKTTGKPVKVLSVAGLSSDIDRFKTDVSTMEKDISNLENTNKSLLGNRRLQDLSPAELILYERNKVQKEALQTQLPIVRSNLNARRKWYQTTDEQVLANNPNSKLAGDSDLTSEEIALYKKFENDPKAGKLRKEIENNALGYAFPEANTGPYSTKVGEWLSSIGTSGDEHEGMRKELTKYIEVKNKVNKRRDNYLAKLRYNPVETDAVNVGLEDGKAIAAMMFSSPQGLKLFTNGGESADKLGSMDSKGISWFSPKGDNYKMSFADNQLLEYMIKNKVTPIVEQVGNTTKIGTGNAVVKITFDDPNGGIPKSPFYIEVTPELQKQIASRLSTNKDVGVKGIAAKMQDDEANDLRRQLITPTMQRTVGKTDELDPVTFTILVNSKDGGQKIPFQVTKFAAADGTDKLNITGESPTGERIPLPNTQSGTPGWFNGADDFIEYIKAQRTPPAPKK